MRIKTLCGTVKEICKLDPESAVGESFLMSLVQSGELPHTYHGNRLVVDYDIISSTFNRLLGFDENGALPQIRTIRRAVEELKQNNPDMGIGEKLIRGAVKDGRIPSIKIGNREYIAMQSFDEPYCRRIFEPTATVPISRAEAVRHDVMEQMEKTIASSPFLPTVIRARKAG